MNHGFDARFGAERRLERRHSERGDTCMQLGDGLGLEAEILRHINASIQTVNIAQSNILESRIIIWPMN